ncbi:DeoR/GlpR family DNA-binding transcription regulator [Sediminispirochaeta smaragdinae]|uniref:Transcriptional regulator, DeoR family n=1 Tax=Sediminispirochaeta smaragdinae (strain DSM 11293 / JCM 15392 / SEBR 4228) TaxID=573413 RepID=E1R8N9_SEDSS|nr:DeoR/GlpR family DNA-binding transcription regulator [Sediminispirochaeta smaragdinae]ADK81796.1 transcriptional regulator, DeoR family [Sediminispirochaeta smaragdinae DSM 11293]
MQQISKRQNEILQIIKKNASINVKDLFPLYPVSSATIRKDLSILEEANLIIRKRGEAHIVDSNTLTPFELRSRINHEIKVEIAKCAVNFINDGDSIILDSGTTTLEIARLLSNKNSITVLTNSLPVATVLANTQVSVSLSGGMLFSQNMSTQGPDAEAFFSRVKVDKAFIAASGVRLNEGLAALSPFEAHLKRFMIKAANEVFGVFDSTKFDAAGINLFAGYGDIDYVITDKTHLPEMALEKFERDGLSYILADKQ